MVKLLVTQWMVYHYEETGVLPNSVTREGGNRDLTRGPMVTLKQLQSLMAVIGDN